MKVRCIIILIATMFITSISVCTLAEEGGHVISVQTDKKEYDRGESVWIYGTLRNTDGNWIPNESVGVQVIDPQGNNYKFFQLRTNENGFYYINYTTDSDEDYGNYTVYVSYGWARDNKIFEVAPNMPPDTPSNPSPSDGVTDVDVDIDLSWSGGDPNIDDMVAYDVYFGTTSSPQKVVDNQSTKTHDCNTLSYDITYYWRIISWDGHGLNAVGPIWSFTTKPAPSPGGEGGGGATEPEEPEETEENELPVADADGPYVGYVNDRIIFDGSGSNDSDGYIASWSWDFGDNTSGNGEISTHVYAEVGTYMVILTVTDDDNTTDSDTSMVTIDVAEKKPVVLFDVLLELFSDSVYEGEKVTALITLINVGEPGLVNGTVNYTLYRDGVVVWTEVEEVSVSAEKAYNKTISTEGLGPGDYSYSVVYNYGVDQTASAEVSFSVRASVPSKGIPVWVPIVAVFVIVVFIVFFYWFFKERGLLSMQHGDRGVDDVRERIDDILK